MNEARELKQIKQFATGNKVRDLIIKEISPTVQKVEEECQQIRRQMKIFKQNYSNVLRFQNEKGVIDRNWKQLTRQLFELKNQVAALKSESDLAQAMNTANNSNIKEEILSFERGLARREETLLSYDKKLNGIMDNLSKHQNYVGDRLTIFQQKFTKLSKQTLEISKDIKKEFDSCNLNNQILKNELVAKLKHSENRQGILDLYMREREENAQKILQIEQALALLVKLSEFQEYKRIQKGFMEDNHIKITTFLENALPNETLSNLKLMNVKFAEIEELKQKSRKVEEQIKRSIRSVQQSIKSIEQAGEEKMAKMRTENEEIEQKIIEEIDKRFQTIEENIEQRGTQTEVDLEAKLKQLQIDIQLEINRRLEKQDRQIYQIKSARTMINDQGQEKMISKQLEAAKSQRQKIQSYGQQIKEIADGLNDRLILFANRITMARSDIDIFTADTKKQLKKISNIKLQLQNNMQSLGKLLASIVESITILTSLSITAQMPNERNAFSTYHDGLILQVEPTASEKEILYRRHLTRTSSLKESLLYCLLTTIDQTILNTPALKWDCYKPSYFYQVIKDNLDLKAKAKLRNVTLSIHSPRKKSNSKIDEEDTYFELRKDGEETNTGNQKSRITVANANTLWPLQRPNSEVQRRYKMKKPEQLMARRQSEERHCFTASRSHRKTKISYI